MKKLINIALIDTDGITCLIFNKPTMDLFFLKKPDNALSDLVQGKHLYILSDDKIKGGDYIYENGKDVVRCVEILGNGELTWKSIDGKSGACDSIADFKKVIATTDESLGLPLLSKSFIILYVDLFQDNTPIAKGYIEYEPYFIQHFDDGDQFSHTERDFRAKVNGQNEVHIIIDCNFNLEELRRYCFQAFINHKAVDGTIKPSDAVDMIEPFQKWFEKNITPMM